MQNASILIVEDERLIARDLKNRLESMHYSVTGICDTGEDAVDQAEKMSLDLILMDILLKGDMDGIDAAKIIQERYDVPVIYLTSYSDEKTLQRAKLTEPFGFILKMANDDALNATIKMALYKHQMIKEKELLNRRLFQAQKLVDIGRLTGGIAHDFNNMLTIISGYSEMAISVVDKSLPLYHDLIEIKKATVQSARLTRQLLLFSRSQSFEYSNININEIIQESIKLFGRVLCENIVIETRLQEEVWEIWGDLCSFEQLLMNLAINASDAMIHGGGLEIKTENTIVDEANFYENPHFVPGRFVLLSITDNGAGMNEFTLSKIFDPFFTSKEAGHGTGLGLSVVHDVVENHKGWINVESKPGKGTKFSIYFPATDQRLDKAKDEIKSWEDLKGHGEQILFVEDNEGVRQFAVTLLREYGYRVIEAETRQKALMLFERENKNIHLLFSDIILPDGNGFQIAEEMQSQNKNIHILLSSGYSNEGINQNLFHEKNYGFIEKPYNISEMLKAVSNSCHAN